MAKTLLVVGGGTAVHGPLQALLRPLRHQVVAVDDGLAALAATAQHRPDLVLIDVGTRGLSGLEVCARLNANPSYGRPVVAILSGLGTPKDRARVWSRGRRLLRQAAKREGPVRLRPRAARGRRRSHRRVAAPGVRRRRRRERPCIRRTRWDSTESVGWVVAPWRTRVRTRTGWPRGSRDGAARPRSRPDRRSGLVRGSGPLMDEASSALRRLAHHLGNRL